MVWARSISVSMPSRAYTSFLRKWSRWMGYVRGRCVNALSGLYLISTNIKAHDIAMSEGVSMPSRAYTSFLQETQCYTIRLRVLCQCPLGLIPHFYGENINYEDVKNVCVNALSGLYLISTLWYKGKWPLSIVSMPSRAYTSFLRKSPWRCNGAGRVVSMPSRAYTSFLRYPFKNLGFMRFPEPVFAGIYQNILTTAVFRAC